MTAREGDLRINRRVNGISWVDGEPHGLNVMRGRRVIGMEERVLHGLSDEC